MWRVGDMEDDNSSRGMVNGQKGEGRGQWRREKEREQS